MKIRAFLSKWKPTAKLVVGCLVKLAGGAAAAADPANHQLYQCLTAGTEQAAEHFFESLPAEQQREVEDRINLLQPYLDQHADLIRRLEALADQQAGQDRSVEALTELIGNRLPNELKTDVTRCLQGLGGIQRELQEIKGILKNFKQGVSYESEEERAYLREQRQKFRELPRERQKAADWSNMADRLSEAGLFELAAEEHKNAAWAAEQENNQTLAAAEHFKAFRASCEKEQWPTALASLRQAVQLNPQLAPFDWEQFELLQILGAGGFGTVFRCRDRHLEEEVAIKSIHTGELARGVQEVFKEAAILTKLKHPAIIGVKAARFADATKQRPYIVMEYFPSRSLAARLKMQGPLPVADFLRTIRPVAEALLAAHNARPERVLHRDIKPDNILEGEAEEIKVIDYGLALRVEAALKSTTIDPARRTQKDLSYLGTLEYAPPEQQGQLSKPVGPYSDIFAFGRTCCKLLFGVPTFHRHPDPKKHHWNRKQDPLPQPLVDILERCQQHAVEDRPQDFQEILDVLDQLDDPVPPPPPPPPKPSKLGMKFAMIQPGTFIMGSPADEEHRQGDEQQYGVRLTKGFYMGVHPVTRGQFASFVKAKHYKTEAEIQGGAYIWTGSEFKLDPKGNWRNPGFAQQDDHPVVCVSWNDAQAFCQWLSEVEGKKFTLPTEAQWEYACRAGTVTPFHFGDTLSTDLANHDGIYTYGSGKKGEFRQGTTPVDKFPANDWGLRDMHGNVWEWIEDWYGPYPEADIKDLNRYIKDPKGANSGDARVMRGGSWYNILWTCGAAHRNRSAPGNRSDDLGFRVCFPLD